MRRRLPWALLALVTVLLALAAAGCGGDEEAEPAAEPPAETVPPAEEPPAEEPPAEEPPAEEPPAEEPPSGEGISVGLVTDTGGVNDRGFNEFSINGLEQAEADLGITQRIYVSNAAEDYLPNLSSACEDGHNLVIAVGFLLAPDTITVATDCPDSSFAGVDHFYGTAGSGDGCDEGGTCVVPNALGLLYPSEEAGYLAGIVAAMMSETGTISTVGGIKIPPVDNWIAGFQQGAYSVNPDITLLNAYSQDFVDQAKCKEIALDQIAQGSDVVFQVAGQCGLGALDAAAQEGVWGIGVDADQSFAGDHILTSALKPLTASVYAVIQSVVDGTFQGGTNLSFSIVDYPDAELLAPFSPDVPQEVQDAVATAIEGLKSGEIDPTAVVEEVVPP
jgi:basic membrane protein A and related proteins